MQLKCILCEEVKANGFLVWRKKEKPGSPSDPGWKPVCMDCYPPSEIIEDAS